MKMRNIQQGLVFTCGVLALLVSGCAWDGKEMPAQAAQPAQLASAQVADEGMQISRMFETAKREAVVADLPAQF
jgi:hypothetical protein